MQFVPVSLLPRRALELSLVSNASLAFACLAATSAGAFSVSSAVSTPCHEPITMEALRNTRANYPAAAPLVSFGRTDKAVISDLPFKVDDDMRDLGAVSLLIGVRDNDLKGRDPNELDALALVHGDPALQREHCLRGVHDDEPEGTQNALRECRGFIREMFADALDGLNEEGEPMLESRLSTRVGLSLRGKVAVDLPRFYVRIGQALHAVQDSFTHNYRAEDRTRVSVTLNYVDMVSRDYLAERDGPRHSTELDRCDAKDAVRSRNRELAVEASTLVLSTALAQELTREEKLAALDGVLDQYLGFEFGCVESNGWCNAPEAGISSGAGCGYSEGAGLSSLGMGLFALLALLRNRRRTRRIGGALLALGLVLPMTARAQSTPAIPPEPIVEEAPLPPPPPPPAVKPAIDPKELATPFPAEPASPPIDSKEAARDGAIVPITPSEVQAVQTEAKVQDSFFSIYVAGAGSLYNVGAAGILGIRFRMNEYWQLGLDGEINGWYGIHSRQLQWGATNAYLSLVLRIPLKYERVSLRSTAQLGVAVEMLELAGVPEGSTGVFGGLNPLGIEIKLGGHLALIFYPLGIALPVTQLKGAPFAFPQFRTTLGLEVSF
jgi:hypothetical protein